MGYKKNGKKNNRKNVLHRLQNLYYFAQIWILDFYSLMYISLLFFEFAAAGTIPMGPSSPFQGSPQPSPTTQNQFLQYLPQVMPQQQGNQPPMHQAVLAPPNQHPHMLMMQQQGGPQPVMTGIPVSGSPGNPMMQQFIPGKKHVPIH